MTDSQVTYHRDAELFREAIRYTAAETGFAERLVEKDYYCSVVLADFAVLPGSVVFKGGTSLSKVHGAFFRLSEDLDFSISTSLRTTRTGRRKLIAGVKTHLEQIEERLPSIRISEPFRGFHNSTQYALRLAYTSVVTGQDEFVKIEVSVREPVVEPPIVLPANTLLLDPFRRTAAVPPFDTVVLSLRETYAEKLRAALSRRIPAIRDFFDIDRGLLANTVRIDDEALLELLRRKLEIRGNDSVDMSPQKLDLLRTQLEPQLRPVLREPSAGSRPQLLYVAASRLGDAKASSIPFFASLRLGARPPSLRAHARSYYVSPLRG